MIKYALICDASHAFESWFRDSDAFETQAKRGFVTCPDCQSALVRKAIMAPAIATRRAVSGPEPEPPEPVPVLDERDAAMRTMVRKFRRHIADNTEDVGPRFPEEARAMHDGEMEARPIMGEASPRQARELIEDGIAILPVPVLPDERH